VWQTAGAAYAADDGNILRCYAYLGHCLMQRGQEEVVTTAGTPARLTFLEILCTVITHNSYFFYYELHELFFYYELHELYELFFYYE
jgi:hypothetical protein